MKPKLLPAKGIGLDHPCFSGHYFTVWQAEVPEGWTVAELIDPGAWKHYAKKLAPRDVVMVDSVDGTIDCDLRVIGATVDGLMVRLRPLVPIEDEVTATEMRSGPQMHNGKPVPRVEHTRATKWRGIGLDGNEIFRDFETRAEAMDELKNYAAVHRVEVAA